MYTFGVKIRLAGRVSYVQVTARDSAHARMLVAAQHVDAVTILQTKRAGVGRCDTTTRGWHGVPRVHARQEYRNGKSSPMNPSE